MSLLTSRQVFYTIDSKTLLPISSKDRVDVHRDGDWHMAVTAFIVRKSPKSSHDIEVLVQKRSQYVDIAQSHFDQSLATQLLLEDENDPESAVYRGLMEELGIQHTDVNKIFQWNQQGNVFIAKQYEDNPELWNREIVTNYIISLKDDVSLKLNFKVNDVEWLPWEEFCNLILVQPLGFTKSVRIYGVTAEIASHLFKSMTLLLGDKTPTPFASKIYYFSFPSFDLIFVSENGTGNFVIDVYRTDYSMLKVKRVKRYLGEDINLLLNQDESKVGLKSLLTQLQIKL